MINQKVTMYTLAECKKLMEKMSPDELDSLLSAKLRCGLEKEDEFIRLYFGVKTSTLHTSENVLPKGYKASKIVRDFKLPPYLVEVIRCMSRGFRELLVLENMSLRDMLDDQLSSKKDKVNNELKKLDTVLKCTESKIEKARKDEESRRTLTILEKRIKERQEDIANYTNHLDKVSREYNFHKSGSRFWKSKVEEETSFFRRFKGEDAIDEWLVYMEIKHKKLKTKETSLAKKEQKILVQLQDLENKKMNLSVTLEEVTKREIAVGGIVGILDSLQKIPGVNSVN